ncbi:YihY/virulence factor BrkB family protein [Arthrobacter sp. H14]|uniref:YihY/virulence factor BrkB family protein n=1 Tax=Arthrobacter sp. H14 TaxID=1312959 RepID=UPI00047B7978|nr:YihY/virulence factor BrkB family protein [Arthrobacter sp. H14]
MSTRREDAAAKAGSAPHPEDDRKPDSPAKISKPARKYILKKTLGEFTADQCTDLAAALTYYAVLSIFPALLALVSLLGVVGQAQRMTDAMLSLVEGVAPGATASVEPVITNLVNSPAAGLTLIIGLAAAIWSASGYVGAFGRAMNKVYEIDEGRPFWKLKPVMLLITLVLLLMVVLIATLLVVSGPIAETIGNVVGLGSVAVLIWSIAKWPVLIFFAVLMVAILYYATPNVKQPKFKWMSLGALFALIMLAVASLGFYFYVSNFGSYNATYGAIGGVIVALLWFWLANLSLLFGAELDAEMERGRQLQAGFAAEETIQLPPRDTRQSRKLRKKEDDEVRQGRELREDHGRDKKEQL